MNNVGQSLVRLYVNFFLLIIIRRTSDSQSLLCRTSYVRVSLSYIILGKYFILFHIDGRAASDSRQVRTSFFTGCSGMQFNIVLDVAALSHLRIPRKKKHNRLTMVTTIPIPFWSLAGQIKAPANNSQCEICRFNAATCFHNFIHDN